MTTTTGSDVYYDPYDVEIDADPYPVFRRLRDEAPLYHNDKYDFYALSRFDDVERGLVDRETYISGRGAILELIKADIEMPPGVHHLRGPADPHHAPRPAVAGVHARRRWTRSSRRSASSARRAWIPLVGAGGFDFIARPRCPDADAGDRHAARHPRGGPGGDPRPVRRRPADRSRDSR